MSTIADDRLRLIVTCCHPALPTEERVALALRAAGWLGTGEIAWAFLVSEATMAQRLARAGQKIRQAGTSCRVLADHLLPGRLPAVLAVIYLVFNEGFAATAGQAHIRRALCAEAIRLGRLLAAQMPDEPEAGGLLALVLLHDARREARLDAAGDLIVLADQDRSRWDRDQIAEGRVVLERAPRRAAVSGGPGPYQIQAAIAAVHDQAACIGDTDWPQLARLYGQLARLTPSPVVELNRAVAVAEADGPAAGLAMLDRLADAAELAASHLFHAARASLLVRLGRNEQAAAAYRQALPLAGTAAERRLLTRRLAHLTGWPAPNGGQ